MFVVVVNDQQIAYFTFGWYLQCEIYHQNTFEESNLRNKLFKALKVHGRELTFPTEFVLRPPLHYGQASARSFFFYTAKLETSYFIKLRNTRIKPNFKELDYGGIYMLAILPINRLQLTTHQN